jgi:hypothetical protein
LFGKFPEKLLSLIRAKQLAQTMLAEAATTTKSKAADHLVDMMEQSKVPKT